jgi:hypothetical protein
MRLNSNQCVSVPVWIEKNPLDTLLPLTHCNTDKLKNEHAFIHIMAKYLEASCPERGFTGCDHRRVMGGNSGICTYERLGTSAIR